MITWSRHMSQASHDLSRPLPISCDDFCSFAMIFSDLQWFLPLANILHSMQTPVWYHAALWKFYSSVKQLPRTPACWDINLQGHVGIPLWPDISLAIQRYCDGHTSAQQVLWARYGNFEGWTFARWYACGVYMVGNQHKHHNKINKCELASNPSERCRMSVVMSIR
jgi:hypothetical protein